MKKYNFNEANELAMRLGLVAGTMWIASFSLVVWNIPSATMEFGYLLGIASIPVMGMQFRRLRRHVDGMSLRNTWWMSWFTFIYAVLLLTIAQYIYFRWIDNGRMVEGLLALISNPEVTEVYRQMGNEKMLNELKDAVSLMGEAPIKELVMSFMSSNLLIGMLSSFLATFMTIGSTYKEQTTNRE